MTVICDTVTTVDPLCRRPCLLISCTCDLSDREPGAEKAYDFRHIRIPCSKSELVEKCLFEFSIIQEAKYVLLLLIGPPYLEGMT